MNLKQALEVAITNENKVRDHYTHGAQHIQDPKGKKVFETLAKEEQGHVDYLQSRLSEWTKSGKVSLQEVATVLPPVEVVHKAALDLKNEGAKRVADKNEVEVLKVALELELTTSAFYRDLITKLSPEDQKLFLPFQDIENGHVTIVQAELDSVTGLGYWFDIMEFQLEAG